MIYSKQFARLSRGMIFVGQLFLSISVSSPLSVWAIVDGPWVKLPESERDRVFGDNHFAIGSYGRKARLDDETTRYAGVSGDRTHGTSLRRQMLPVKNQGERGTCSVFAAVSLAEFIVGKPLSEQCLAKFSSDEDPGKIGERLEWLLKNGLQDETDCPYHFTKEGRHRISSRADSGFLNFPYARVVRAPPTIQGRNRIDVIRKALASGLPVGITLYIPGRWWREDWDKSTLNIPSNEEIRAWEKEKCTFGKRSEGCRSHALVITGFDDRTESFEIRNSWSRTWKDQGYARISYWYLEKFHTVLPMTWLAPNSGLSDESLVKSWYQEFLNRDPDASAFNHWVKTTKNVGRETAKNMIRDSDEGFVNACYKEHLDRFPDSGGLNYWHNIAREQGRAAAKSGISGSAEAHYTFVRRCYREHLDRDADKGGLQHWSNVALREGMDKARQGIAGSEEAHHTFVRRCYRNYLGREADEGGLKFWTKEIYERGRDHVHHGIKNSPEAMQCRARK